MTIDLKELGLALKHWRSVFGLKRDELAEKSGVAPGTYARIESGDYKPSVKDLESLAKALNLGLLELLSPPKVSLSCVRFRSAKKLKSRTEVLLQIARDLRAYRELEEVLDQRQDFLFFSTVSEGIKDVRDPIAAAAICREALELGNETIRDICGLLEERANVKVLLVDLQNPEFFGLSVRDPEIGASVAVNTWERISIERQIFTAAHELGHLVLHPDDYDASKETEEKARENEANLFASHFLMPKNLFEIEYKDAKGLPLVDRVLKVKRIFRVSYKTVLYRLSNEYGMKDAWQTFNWQYKKRFNKTLKSDQEVEPCTSLRSEEIEQLNLHDFIPDRKARLVIQAIKEEKLSISRGAEILQKSLNEFRDYMMEVHEGGAI